MKTYPDAGLDFETLGAVNLPVHGMDNYMNDPLFRPLIAALWTPNQAEVFDFVDRRDGSLDRYQWEQFELKLDTYPRVAAHNSSFEDGVLRRMRRTTCPVFLDSAVIARAMGAGSKLEAAAPQLLGVDKMEQGSGLIMKFSVPQKDGTFVVDNIANWSQEDWNDWELFKKYCLLDAQLSYQIAAVYPHVYTATEVANDLAVQMMNHHGWFVDVELVQQMQRQYEKNLVAVEAAFRSTFNVPDLNFRSTPQLRAWCAERGIIAKSFDELNVKKLIVRIEQRLTKMKRNDPMFICYVEVLNMLKTKQALGGSSLSKLQKILDTVGADGRLRNQYLHIGAGQTFRTSGQGVQLQNLKRLGANIGDVDGDLDEWDNEELARNLRQVFKAQHPKGELIVGDFSAVESRGLAYLAGAEWKLDAYRQGKDMYKVLASSMMGVPYESVSKQQRQTGKVGELSCGYGAGADSVRSFAEKMGTILSEDEAKNLVRDWRETNPEIVQFWYDLNDLLYEVVRDGQPIASMIRGDLKFIVQKDYTPGSIRRQRPDATTIKVSIVSAKTTAPILQRWFQGAYMHGNDICYLKPSELKSGKLWLEEWSKDGQRGRYKIYGGKLAGILTQSFCRELFFHSLRLLHDATLHSDNVWLIGQFHDELVLEWVPADPALGGPSLEHMARKMRQIMSSTPLWAIDFPLDTEVNHSHRYIK